MTHSLFPNIKFKLSSVLFVSSIIILVVYIFSSNWCNYIKKSQVTRVYSEISSVKTSVEASFLEGKIPVVTLGEEAQNPDKFEWIGWRGSDMVDTLELNSIKKGNTTYWYMVSTLGGSSDPLLHNSQLVLFHDGLQSEDVCLDSERQLKICDPARKETTSNKKQQNSSLEIIMISSTEEVEIEQKGRWHCRFYIGDKKKLAKETLHACAVVFDKFQNSGQLLINDSKGNRLINRRE